MDNETKVFTIHFYFGEKDEKEFFCNRTVRIVRFLRVGFRPKLYDSAISEYSGGRVAGFIAGRQTADVSDKCFGNIADLDD